MKIYARQIPPEYQQSPFEYDEGVYDNISVCGNRNFKEHLQPVFKRVREILENGELSEALNDIKNKEGYWTSFYKNVTEAINDLLPPEKEKYSIRDIGAIKKVVESFDSCNIHRENKKLCEVLGLVTGNEWDYRTISGVCQSDWNEVFYQVKDFPNGLKHFEIEYFNMGSEWIVHEEDFEPETADDIEGYTLYCYSYNNEGIKGEIMESVGVTEAEVVLYKFDDWTRTAKYKKVSA